MTLSSVDQTLQLIAWSVALVEFTLALYVLVLNARHTANRHAALFLLDETPHRVGREQLISETAADFVRSIDTDTMRQTAVRELGRSSHVSKVSAHIAPPEAPAPTEGDQEVDRNGGANV